MKRFAVVVALVAVSAGCTRSQPPRGRADPVPTAETPPASPSPAEEVPAPAQPERHLVWVAVEDEHRVVAVDVGARKVVRRFPVSGGAHNITVAHDGTVAVALPDVGRVALIRKGRVREVQLGGSPHDVKPWGPFVVVANEGASTVQVISTHGEMVRSIALEAPPHDLAPSTRDKTVWASLDGTDRLAEVEPGGSVAPRYVPTGEQPHDLLFSPGGRPSGPPTRLWVTGWDGEVHVLTPRGSLLRTLGLGAEAHHLAFGAGGSEVWVTDHESRLVFVVDTRSFRVLRTFTIQGAPHHVAITLGGTRAVVADHERGSLLVFDAMRLRRLGAIPVGEGPHGVWAELPA